MPKYKTLDTLYLLSIFVFTFALLLPFVINNVLLTDDLIRVYGALGGQNISNFSDFLYEYLNHETMTSRPVSGFFTAVIVYLTGFNEKFYYLGYSFFMLAIYFVFKLTTCLSNNVFFSTITTAIYCLIPIGTSLLYSPLMLNSNLATILYCASLIIIIEKKQTAIILFFSLLLFMLSVLSYEIFAPLVLLNLLLLKKSKIIYLLSIISSIVIYRQFIEPNVFTNYFHRSDITQLFNVKRNIIVVFELIKAFTYDFIMSIYRSIRAISYFNWYDYLLLGIFSLFTFYYIKRREIVTEFSNILNIRLKLLIILGVFLATLIYFGSSYSPNLLGYNNRTMGAIRLYGVLLLCYFLFQNKRPDLLFTLILIFSISAITVKNAWLYSFKNNNEIFNKIRAHDVPTNIDIKFFYVIFDQKNMDTGKTFMEQQNNDRNVFFSDSHFILQEPMYLETC